MLLPAMHSIVSLGSFLTLCFVFDVPRFLFDIVVYGTTLFGGEIAKVSVCTSYELEKKLYVGS